MLYINQNITKSVKKQVILLMTSDGKKYHYFAVTNSSRLLQGNSSNHKGDSYCLNCFNSYTTKNKLKEHEEICNNHDSCRIEMLEWVNKTIKYNPGEKSLRKPFVIYLDLECLLKNYNPTITIISKNHIQKKAKHELSGWAMYIKCSFDEKENKLNYYRGKDCIEKLCKKLKEGATEIINHENKEMIPLTKKGNKLYIEQEKCHIYEEKFCIDKDDKNYINKRRLKIIVIILENLEGLPIVNAI